MIGDANGVLFFTREEQVNKIKCSVIPIESYQIRWVFYKSQVIAAISKKCVKLLRIDFSIEG